MPAALWRKHRLGELAAEDTAVLVEEFEWDWYGEPEREASFSVIAITGQVLDDAARSVARHPLRAFNAIQLASALAARAADSTLTTFACFDVTLANAARVEGFTPLT